MISNFMFILGGKPGIKDGFGNELGFDFAKENSNCTAKQPETGRPQ